MKLDCYYTIQLNKTIMIRYNNTFRGGPQVPTPKDQNYIKLYKYFMKFSIHLDNVLLQSKYF